MISKTAETNYNFLWKTLNNFYNDFGGVYFHINTLNHYFKKEFVNGLTAENAKRVFYYEMEDWGKLARRIKISKSIKHRINKKESFIQEVVRNNPRAQRLWNFIIRSYFNLSCLAYHRKTIEQLIFEASKYYPVSDAPDIKHKRKVFIQSFKAIMSLCNAFILSEWLHDIFYKAVANNDKEVFRVLSNSIKRNTLEDFSGIAKDWLGIIMLWYLGGKDLKPQKKFIELVASKGLINKDIPENDFTSMLSKLGLTQKN